MTGARTLRPTATHIPRLLEDLTLIARPTLPKGMTLSIDNQMGDTPVLLDSGLVQDGLLNLILNARDACGAAGAISLEVRQVHDTWIEWVLRDTGPGFSPSALEHGFDPFFTTKGAEGSGLGLPMVYDMVKSAGGDLRLGNTAHGAQVTMRLPYRPAVAATTGLVLLVEDADDLRALVRDMLMGLGHSVIEAASADEATALLADLPDIALILSDIQLMGEATGLDLAKRLPADAPPLVLMTSLPPDDAQFFEAQTLAPVLRKPFEIADLTALIAPKESAAQ